VVYTEARCPRGDNDAVDRAPKQRLDLLSNTNIYLKLICADRHLAEGSSYESIVAMSRAGVEKAPDRSFGAQAGRTLPVMDSGKEVLKTITKCNFSFALTMK
jgi:hypothetical protein